MDYKIQASSGQHKFPVTQVYPLLDQQAFLFLRSWNGQDSNQLIIDEISHYLSSAHADLEVTTPFDFDENLSSNANKIRVALLLANDLVLKTENKQQYMNGAEVSVIYLTGHELAWGVVGRFQITAEIQNQNYTLLQAGYLLDEKVLLPTSLLGVSKDLDLICGSIKTNNLQSLEVSSEYDHGATSWKSRINNFIR